MGRYRDCYLNEIDVDVVGKELKIAGWIENIRDHGGVIFVDIRDEFGVVQVVSNDDSIFNGLTKESTVSIKGIIRQRQEEDYNEKIKSGKVELVVDKKEDIEVLGKCKNILPFEIITSKEVNEEARLKYRYLDLRNKKVHDNMRLRSDVLHFVRNKLYDEGFTELQTPILTASSPEGARDFIVPSRKWHGCFYALPQAPQIFKQLLMTSGFDKYFQVAPCFRDEDCRADRTLEFYQIDIERAFVTEEDLYKDGEDFFYDVFTKFSDREVSPKPFTRIDYRTSMLKYGTDKPDLRNPLIINDISEIFKESDFKPFRGAVVRAIKVDDLASKSNSWFNEVVDYAKSIGMPGIGYITVQEDKSLKGPIDKFLTEEDRDNLFKTCDLKVGSVLFFIADRNEKIAAKQAGNIRKYLGERLELIDKNRYEFCIINDFPMYELNEDTGKYDFGHNPFSMPQGGIDVLTEDNIENIKAYQFDFVCNGEEMASGAIRNHDIEIMKKAFELAGYTEEDVKTRFKSLYTAFQYGAPPHGGYAPGLDRILMLLKDEENLREVQVFPPNVNGMDNMMGSPSPVAEQQLREVHIKVRNKNV